MFFPKYLLNNTELAKNYRKILGDLEECRNSYVVGDQPGVLSQNRNDAERVEGMFTNFFISCYHLKDLLKTEPSAPETARSSVETYINNSKWLKYSADITNEKKHGPRSGNIRVHKDVKLRNHPMITGPIGTFPVGGVYKFTIDVELEAHGRVDALQVAQGCLDEWRVFFEKYEISLA